MTHCWQVAIQKLIKKTSDSCFSKTYAIDSDEEEDSSCSSSSDGTTASDNMSITSFSSDDD